MEGERPRWMRDIRRKLHRELLVRQAQPGMAVQSKVHYVLQVRRREATSNASNALQQEQQYFPSMIPFREGDDRAMFAAPEALKTSTGQGGTNSNNTSGASTFSHKQRGLIVSTTPPSASSAPQNPAQAKLIDSVVRELTQRGFDDITKQMLTTYIATNPEAIEVMCKEIRLERAEARRLRRSQALLNHRHVFPEELIFGSRTTAFPRAPMDLSTKDVVSTRTGTVSRIIENVSPVLEDDEATLAPIHLFGKTPSLSDSMSRSRVLLSPLHKSRGGAPTTTLGDHLPTYVCQGIPIVFDSSTISTLTSQNGAILDSIVGQQNADYGPLELVPLEEDLRLHHHAHDHHSRTPSPSGDVIHVPWKRGDPRRNLSADEIQLFVGASNHQKRLTMDSNAVVTRSSPKPVEAPEGLLKQLLRSAEMDNDDSDDDLIDPRCVVCHDFASQKSIFSKRHDLRDSSRVANESLLRWKAQHQLAQVEATASLDARLRLRQEHSKLVAGNASALAQVANKAKRDAQGWLRSRSGTGSPLPSSHAHHESSGASTGTSVWDAPSHEILSRKSRWRACVLLWERLGQFLELLQWPQTEAQESMLRVLQEILQQVRCLTPLILPLWMRQCGLPLCRQRENFRVLSFVRCSLGVPHTTLVAWTRLSSVKTLGIELISD